MRRFALLAALSLALCIGQAAAQPRAQSATTNTSTNTSTTTSTATTTDAGPPGAAGVDLPSDVAEEQITVSSDYRGSTITVFGANPDRRARGDVVVVVRGPDVPATVMRKKRVLGL